MTGSHVWTNQSKTRMQHRKTDPLEAILITQGKWWSLLLVRWLWTWQVLRSLKLKCILKFKVCHSLVNSFFFFLNYTCYSVAGILSVMCWSFHWLLCFFKFFLRCWYVPLLSLDTHLKAGYYILPNISWCFTMEIFSG